MVDITGSKLVTAYEADAGALVRYPGAVATALIVMAPAMFNGKL